MKRKVISVLLTMTMVAAMAIGCGSKESAETSAKSETITLKVFSNLPDRKNGQGLVEQMLIDEYMEQNKNVVIEVEALDHADRRWRKRCRN